MKALIVYKDDIPDVDLIKKHFSDVKTCSLKKDGLASYVPKNDVRTATDGFEFLKHIPDILSFDFIVFSDEILPKEVASLFANYYRLGIIAHTFDFKTNKNVVAFVHSWGNLGMRISSKTVPTVFIMEKTQSKYAQSIEKIIDFPEDDGCTLLTVSEKPKSEIETAKLVVGVGLGVSKEMLPNVISFAKNIGAAVVCTRPVANLGLFEASQVVGDTGIKINPDVYIAFGISGAIQHMSGINAKKIIAVNSDKNAPIFSKADIKINERIEEVIQGLLAWSKSL